MMTGIAAFLVFVGVSHSSGTIHDRSYLLCNGLSGSAVAGIAVITAMVASLLKKRLVASYSGLVALLSGLVAFVPGATENHRVAFTKEKLSDIYSSTAQRGSPFPDRYDFSSVPDSELLISSGYWVSDDHLKFEVYYHIGSDSYTMAYPNQNWQWRGYGYAGPSSAEAEQAGNGNPTNTPESKSGETNKPQPGE